MHVQRQIERLTQFQVGERPAVLVKQIGNQRSARLRPVESHVARIVERIDIVFRQVENHVVFAGHAPARRVDSSVI